MTLQTLYLQKCLIESLTQTYSNKLWSEAYSQENISLRGVGYINTLYTKCKIHARQEAHEGLLRYQCLQNCATCPYFSKSAIQTRAEVVCRDGGADAAAIALLLSHSLRAMPEDVPMPKFVAHRQLAWMCVGTWFIVMNLSTWSLVPPMCRAAAVSGANTFLAPNLDGHESHGEHAARVVLNQ